MAIAPGLIWRAIFVFIRYSLYLFLRKILTGVAKKLRETANLPFGEASAYAQGYGATRDRDRCRMSRIQKETWVLQGTRLSSEKK
jgi:hypothetical protein